MKKAFSLLLVFGLVLCLLPMAAWAETYDIANGSITVSAEANGEGTTQTVTQNGNAHVETTETIITGTSNAGTTRKDQHAANTVTISAGENATANVTLQDLTIHADAYGSNNDKAAVTVKGEGDVNIELDGSTDLVSGDNHAGIEKTSSGQLTIGDDNETAGSLSAKGGSNGAGIGGGCSTSISFSGGSLSINVESDGSDIEITGGDITAKGGSNAAGIGGGRYGDGSDIAISGGEVVAQGGSSGAGIGGGNGGDGEGIEVSGGEVTANGGNNAAGIGGGNGGDGEGIEVSDGQVTANGGNNAAGIGGGSGGDGEGIAISGGNVTANGGDSGAGIGGGNGGDGAGIAISDGDVNANGGSNAAGIGGGNYGGDGSGIAISGGNIVAVGGNGGAGIGGGTTLGGNLLNDTGDGTDIDISGGNVVAQGGSTAAGIGGGGTNTNVISDLIGNYGAGGTGSDITITGAANVSVAGGAGNPGLINTGSGDGAAIGNGGTAFNQTGSSDLEGIDLLGGTLNIYAPGTSANDILSGDAEPTSTEHVHLEGEPKMENMVPATALKEGSYDEVVYCSCCGEELSRAHRILPATADLFMQFNMLLVQRILAAKENETLDVNADIWPGFQRIVFQALAQRSDVALNVRCLIDGEIAELKIPAGKDFLTDLGNKDVLTFADMAKLLG